MEDVRERLEKTTPTVERMAKSVFVDSIPETPEKAVCKKHGEFTFKYSEGFNGNVFCLSTCQSCIKERDEFIDAEVIRIEAEEKAERLERKILNRGVSKRNLDKTFDTFTVKTDEQSKAKRLWQEFADSVCDGKGAKNVIACGSVGTGKTHLASSAVTQIITKGKDCKLVKLIDMIRQYKSTWAKDSENTEQDFLDFYTNLPALIIDEVGVQFGSDTEKMVIFDVIDGRYNNMLPTAIISNKALPEVKELIGERAIDRLREDGGVVVAMEWESYRGRNNG